MAKKAEYGKGHDSFLEYEKFITEHANYAGMPDLYSDDGSIQWEAPSNRTSGKFKDTHHRRRDWWRKKAVEVGIDPESPHWISRTAKLIHPNKQKPCKKCGSSMDIRYAYPKGRLLARLKALPYIDESFPLDPLEHLSDLITRVVEQHGNKVFADLPKILTTSEISPPATLEPTLESWLRWIDEEYIPQEPTTCSPGVMSNAPDRLDGFHSFNLCCRSKADLGRSKANLQSYTTDRRVFEYWVEGDWLAADKIMGLVRSSLSQENCFNGHPGPCAADHIGPISLGFIHRPEFRLLCRTCNSAKNNRMTLLDVEHLKAANAAGEIVTSWYATRLWNLRKNSVVSEETALRLSKLLRDNRHTVMFILNTFAEAGYYSFLASFCGLEYANFDITFENFRTENSLTCYDALKKTARTTKYTAEQMSRRFRVAFSALRDYVAKENRNSYVIASSQIDEKLSKALAILKTLPSEIKFLDKEIGKLIAPGAIYSDEIARELILKLPTTDTEPQQFKAARQNIYEAMNLVAEEMSSKWSDERYVREAAVEEDFID